MFAKPPGDKAYACFVRRYDADHLARHPRQKVGTMKPLVGAEVSKMGNIQNHLDGVSGPDNITVALVVHGPALKAFHASRASPDLAHHVGSFPRQGSNSPPAAIR
jgi:hypothetical protein